MQQTTTSPLPTSLPLTEAQQLRQSVRRALGQIKNGQLQKGIGLLEKMLNESEGSCTKRN